MKGYFIKSLWTLAGLTVLFVIGCGGGGNPVNTTTGGTATTGQGATTGTNGNGQSIATANLTVAQPNITVQFLTGSGRAIGDLSAQISRANFTDSAGNNYSSHLSGSITAGLEQYTVNNLNVILAQPIQTPSQQFSQYELTVNDLLYQGPGGTYITVGNQTPGAYLADQFFPVVGGAFPGRFEVLPIFLDSSSFDLANTNPPNSASLDTANFLATNDPNSTGHLNAIFGDFVHFNISGVANAPAFSASGSYPGQKVTDVYFSGDEVAIGNATSGDFEIVGPNGTEDGLLATVSGNNGGTQNLYPGLGTVQTYTLKVPDPRSINGTGQISAGLGLIREAGTVVNNLGSFEVMLIPHSNDGNIQDAIAFTGSLSGGATGSVYNATNLYYGTVDLSKGTITLNPIGDLGTGSTAGQVTGTLSAQQTNALAPSSAANTTYFGTYNLSGSLPAGFKTTGRFFDFRG